MVAPVNDPIRRASVIPAGGGMASPASQAAAPPPPPTPEDDEAYATELEQKYDLPPGSYVDLIKAGERSGATATSPKGAYGTAQLMPETAREMGVDPHDHRQNMEGGAKYLAINYHKYKDLDKAYAAYNAGPGAVDKYGGVPPFSETKAYLDRIHKRSGATGGGGGEDAERSKVLAEIDADTKGADKADATLKAFVQKHMDQQAKLEAEIEAIKYPTTPTLPETPKPPEAIQTKPLDVMRQFIPVIAALGGLRTRNPATAVLNAMAAAVEARQKNDKEAFAEKNTEFKNKLDEMHDIWTMQREKFLDAFNNTKASVEDRLAALRVEALQMGDAKMLDDIDHGKLDEAYKKLTLLDTAQYHVGMVRANMQKAQLTSQLNAAKLEQQKQYESALGDLQKSDRYQKAEPYQRALMVTDLTRSLMPNNAYKVMQAASTVRKELGNSPVGKSYGNAITQMPVIMEAADKAKDAHFWDKNPMGAMEQAAFLDAYTKLITGGQAIRGFTLKLNTDHASLWDKADVLLQSANKGGPLSKRQITEMADVAKRYANNLDEIYKEAEGKAQDAMAPISAPELGVPFGSGAMDTEMAAGAGGGSKPGGHSVGDIVTGADGKQYRVIGGDPSDPDVEPVG